MGVNILDESWCVLCFMDRLDGLRKKSEVIVSSTFLRTRPPPEILSIIITIF